MVHPGSREIVRMIFLMTVCGFGDIGISFDMCVRCLSANRYTINK